MASPSAAPPSAPSSAPVPQLLQQFLQVQQQRAAQYASLERSFRSFLDTKHEPGFKKALQEATATFNACSLQVISAELSLKAQQRANLAGLLRTVQDNEREKLRLTLTLQSLRQAYAFKTLAFQRAEEEDADPLEPLGPRTCGCGHGAAGGGEHGHQHHHHDGQAEPTRAEYEAAVKEAQLQLDRCVCNINDVIEVVREDLQEEKERSMDEA